LTCPQLHPKSALQPFFGSYAIFVGEKLEAIAWKPAWMLALVDFAAFDFVDRKAYVYTWT
jgi:hypothetical protein